MDFNLSKEQELLRDGLGRFLTTRYDLEKSRTAAKLGAGQQPPGHHHGIDEGFDHQRPAQFLGDHHGLDRPATAAAGRFRQ